MIKRLLPLVLLMTGGFWGATNLSAALKLNIAAQAQPNSPFDIQFKSEEDTAEGSDPDGLYYTFFDRRIRLEERTDQIAVQFVEAEATRGDLTVEPAYLRLQADLEAALADTRDISGESVVVTVEPLGDQFALVTLPEGSTRSFGNDITRQITQPYVSATLPVVTRTDSADSIIITTEIIVTLAPDITDEAAAALVSEYGMKVVRPLLFSPGQYIVQTTEATGTAVLEAANRLDEAPEVQSATPNFVQIVPSRAGEPNFELPSETPEGGRLFESVLEDALVLPAGETGDAQAELQSQFKTELQRESDERAFSFPTRLFPYQWYLNSLPLRPTMGKRTDIYALEAWLKSDSGEGVTIAVIDSAMQWDHPDLINSVYRLPPTVSNPLPGEVSGWDFSSYVVTCEVDDTSNCVPGDPDTRLDNKELSVLKPKFQNTFTLSDEDLLASDPQLDAAIRSQHPEYTIAQRAYVMRWAHRRNISSLFHGTWSAGVIAARPQTGDGMVGVAPNAQFLPIRVFGANNSYKNSALIEAAGYAAARGVDVMNMSLGGPAPDEEFQKQLARILAVDPDVVIVASAGNENRVYTSYPSANPGVVSVGSSNLDGNRAPYSNFGRSLDVMAPGGDTRETYGGILTAGGTWLSGFWEGLNDETLAIGDPAIDRRGLYVSVQGTSFAAPATSGVVALMMDADENNQLNRDQIVSLLKQSADYDELVLTAEEEAFYQTYGKEITADMGRAVLPQEYFFGWGLVNAEVAVDSVSRAVR